MIVKCSDCGEPVLKVASGRAPSGKMRYVDDKGHTWNGRECPRCKFLTNNSPSMKFQYATIRDCRACGKALPPSLYFYHELCNQVEAPYGEDEYGGYVGRSF